MALVGICSNCQETQTNQLTEQELKIYKTVLGNKSKEVVVIDESRVDVFGEIGTGGLMKIFPALQKDTFDNFAQINSKPTKMEDIVAPDFEYLISNRTEFEKHANKVSRYFVFSRVGFSNDGMQAVVMFSFDCVPLCSEGAYYLLINSNEKWEIVQKSDSWKS